MAERFLEPNVPLKKINNETGDIDYIYPQTVASQVIMDEDGTRLNTILNENILWLDDAEDGGSVSINADTLGGHEPSYFAVRSNYDSNNDGIVDNADNGIFSYTYSKSGTVHSLTGTGKNIKFYASSVWNPGDKLQINGKDVQCFDMMGNRIEEEEIFGKAIVTCTLNYDGSACFFKLGGVGLNFKIIGATTQPASPKENTIWVNTSLNIPRYSIDNIVVPNWTAPTGTVNFAAYICNSVTDKNFSVFKNNEISIRLINAMQYDGTNWVEKKAKIYKNGAWQDIDNPEYLNCWHLIRTATINSQPKPADFVGKTIISESIVADSAINTSLNYGDSYSAKATTYLYFSEETTLSIAFTTDDAGTVYINDYHIGNLTTTVASTLSCPFKAGWNKLEVCYTEGSGNDGWVTNPKFSTHASVKKMYAKL